MTPSDPIFYPADLALAHSVSSSDFFLLARIGSYCKNIFLSQFRGAALLASIRRSMLNAVLLICLRSIPSQIIKMIVCRVSVVVATLASCWRLSKKGEKNETMDFYALRSIVFPQEHKQASIFAPCRDFQMPLESRSNAAKIRNLVEILIANNGQPSLHSSSIYVCGNYT